MITKDELLDRIGAMTVLELQDFVVALKEKFSITAQPNNSLTSAAQDSAEQQQPKTSYDVHLETVGPNKIAVIKAIRETTGLSLKEAKDVADKAPILLKGNLTKPLADALQSKVEAAGAKVNVK